MLEAHAIHLVLLLDPTIDKINPPDFIDKLIERMRPHETSGKEFTNKLLIMKEFFTRGQEPFKTEITTKLGNRVTAEKSVSTAIYCFLRSEWDFLIKNSTAQHPFRNTLEYAIKLGGDTDTIASMACAISGAYYGDEVISKNLINRCEDSENIIKLADKLYEMSVLA